MITMHDLDESIAECQGQPHPNANTCIKLAAYLTIKKSIMEIEQPKPDGKFSTYSYDAPAQDQTVNFDSGTPFSEKINGLPVDDVIAIFDELMETLQAINPPLYAAVMRKL